ncbi:hypothetical protein GCM10027570_44520 [Streptomonospora sediminis]
MWGRETGSSELADDLAAGRRLRELWRSRSRVRRAAPHGDSDWWTPAVDAACTAAVRNRGMAEACGRLGQARARSGISVGATLEDFAAFCDVLGRSQPPISLVTALTEGWVDGGRSQEECRDPLTGLATAAFLRTRLGELYRGASGEPGHGGPGSPGGSGPGSPGESGGSGGSGPGGHRLVVVALPEGLDPWRRTARLIVVGHELGRVFTRGESLALLSRSRMAVLAPDGAGLAERLEALRNQVCAEHSARLWTLPLPPRCAEALALVDAAGSPPMTD